MKRSIGYECKIKRYNDGQERWICIKGDLKCDAYGNPLSYIGTIQDITERKKNRTRNPASQRTVSKFVKNCQL
ncbi:MAG: PAS domain S-box protein [Bacteroidales bacterium]|nr:PAS domain S-box protein [Bacteroidales bacterium]